jgi:hypothetical protein
LAPKCTYVKLWQGIAGVYIFLVVLVNAKVHALATKKECKDIIYEWFLIWKTQTRNKANKQRTLYKKPEKKEKKRKEGKHMQTHTHKQTVRYYIEICIGLQIHQAPCNNAININICT